MLTNERSVSLTGKLVTYNTCKYRAVITIEMPLRCQGVRKLVRKNRMGSIRIHPGSHQHKLSLSRITRRRVAQPSATECLRLFSFATVFYFCLPA
jgi:hypothetical protein